MARIIPYKVAASQRVNTREFLSYVASRGYRANPFLNTTAAAEGQPIKVVGYELIGPRRNRKVVPVMPDGLLPLLDVVLWCDGIDYATSKIRGRR
jgi:hypothetical protein